MFFSIPSCKYQLFDVGISVERRSAAARPRIDLCAAHSASSPTNTKETDREKKRNKDRELKRQAERNSSLLDLFIVWLRSPSKQWRELCKRCAVSVLVTSDLTVVTTELFHRSIHVLLFSLLPSSPTVSPFTCSVWVSHICECSSTFPHIDPRSVHTHTHTHTHTQHTLAFVPRGPLALLCSPQFALGSVQLQPSVSRVDVIAIL